MPVMGSATELVAAMAKPATAAETNRFRWCSNRPSDSSVRKNVTTVAAAANALMRSGPTAQRWNVSVNASN